MRKLFPIRIEFSHHTVCHVDFHVLTVGTDHRNREALISIAAGPFKSGLKDDLPRGFLKRSAEVLAETRKRIGEFETLIMGNEIIYARTRDVGLLPAETARG